MAVTPLAVFDELWAAFSYHCAFLHLRSSTRNWHLASFRETYRARAAALPQTPDAAASPELEGIVGVLADVVRLFSGDNNGRKPDIHCFLTTDEAAVSAGADELASNDPPQWTRFEKARRERWVRHFLVSSGVSPSKM
jgi:hypothetical protein